MKLVGAFIVGVLATAAGLAVSFGWFPLARLLTGSTVVRDTAPDWLRITGEQAWWWIPLAASVLLFGVRAARGDTAGFAPVNAYVLGIVLTYGLPLVYLVKGDTIFERLHRQTFDAAAWQLSIGEESRFPARLVMVHDLLARYDLHDWPRERVETLLGYPDTNDYFHDRQMAYWMGQDPGFMRIASYWLVIRLDGEDRVADYRIAWVNED